MGKLQFAQTKTDLAEKSFDTAVALDRNMHQGWYYKGLIDQQNKKPAAALTNYKKAMSLQPDNVEYVTAVMQMYAASKDHKKAIGLLHPPPLTPAI
jgi:Tfp pilus assembly protein PilF